MAEEIVIKIDVQSSKAKAKLKDTKSQAEDLGQAYIFLSAKNKDVTKAELSLRGEQKLRTEQQKKLNYETMMGGKIAATYENATNKGAAAQKRFKTQAGLNNAILLETGRLASDASFGFTAIANNLSQLVSLGGSFVNTTGSIGSALGELKKSLFGIGGVLLGFQVLIGLLQDKRVQDFIKSLFGLNGNLKVLSELSKDAAKNAETLVGNFRLYTKILKDTSKSEEQRAIALKKLNEEYPEFNANILTEVDNTQEAIRVQNEYIATLRKRAMSDAAKAKFQEIQGRIIEKELDAEVERTIERNKFLEDSNRAIIKQEKSNGEVIMVSQEEKADAYVSSINKINEAVKSQIQEEETKLDFLETLIELEDKKKKDSADYQIKLFEAKYFDFEKIEQKYRERAQKSELLNNEEILAQTLQNEMAKIDITEENFVRREQVRLKNYKKQLDEDVKNEKISRATADKLAQDADAKYLKSLQDVAEKRKNLESEVYNFINSLRTLQIRKDAEIAAREVQQVRRTQERLGELLVGFTKSGIGNDEAFYESRDKLLKDFLKRQNFIIKNAPEGSLIRVQAQMQAAKLEDQIRDNQLRKEIQAIEERKRVNTEYVNFAQGMSSLLGTIAGEDENIKNAALVIEKGAAIAGVVISTQQANATAVANETRNPFIIPNPLPPFVPYPNPTKKASLAATGKQVARNNVSAGISIANILATTLSSFSKPSGGAATVSANVQAPAFNVVGQSTTDQLLTDVRGGLSDVKLNVNLNEINDGNDTLNFIGSEANVFPEG